MKKTYQVPEFEVIVLNEDVFVSSYEPDPNEGEMDPFDNF
jgi:hypothetical protein